MLSTLLQTMLAAIFKWVRANMSPSAVGFLTCRGDMFVRTPLLTLNRAFLCRRRAICLRATLELLVLYHSAQSQLPRLDRAYRWNLRCCALPRYIAAFLPLDGTQPPGSCCGRQPPPRHKLLHFLPVMQPHIIAVTSHQMQLCVEYSAVACSVNSDVSWHCLKLEQT